MNFSVVVIDFFCPDHDKVKHCVSRSSVMKIFCLEIEIHLSYEVATFVASEKVPQDLVDAETLL